MLPTFRLFFVAVGVAVFVLVMAARGLVPAPDVYTRIGEVPSVGRSLVQQAMVPRLSVGPSMVLAQERAQFGEATGSAPVIIETPASAAEPRTRAAATPAPNRTEPQVESPDPLGDLIRSTLIETPEPTPRAVSVLESPASSAPAEKADATKGSAAADPPALAFGAEPPADRKSAPATPGETIAAIDTKTQSAKTDLRPAAPAETKAVNPEPTRRAKAKHKARTVKKEVTRKERVTKRKAAAKPRVHKKASLVHAARRSRRVAAPKRSRDYRPSAISQTAPDAYQSMPPGYQSYHGPAAGSTAVH